MGNRQLSRLEGREGVDRATRRRRVVPRLLAAALSFSSANGAASSSTNACVPSFSFSVGCGAIGASASEASRTSATVKPVSSKDDARAACSSGVVRVDA